MTKPGERRTAQARILAYRQCATMFTEEMPWIPAADMEWIMGRGLSEGIGWK